MAVHLRRKGAALSLTVDEPARSDDPNRYIAALDEVACAAGPFVLLVEFRTTLDLPHAQRKSQNLWFKATRAKMNAASRATAILRKDPSREMQRTFQGLWDFPVLVTDDADAAERFLAFHKPAETVP